MFLFIFGGIVGAAIGWGLTYCWFKRAKVQKKIAADVNSAVAKIATKI